MSGVKGMKRTVKTTVSEETKKKISNTLKKKWKEKEYRENMCNAHKHELPEEWKNNISKGMKGVKKSEETRRKFSEYQSNRPKSVKQKQVKSWKKQWKGLTKEEQLERLKPWIEAGHEANKDGKFLKPSSIEIIVKEQLDELGIKYIQQKRVSDGERNYFLDFYIPRYKLVIECNGDYWHNLPDKKERDKNLKEYVESTGRKIIFIWEHEIKNNWFWIGDYLQGGDANV